MNDADRAYEWESESSLQKSQQEGKMMMLHTRMSSVTYE